MATLPDIPSFGGGGTPQPASGVAGYEPPNWRQVGVAGQEISGAGRDLQQAADTIAQTNDRQDALVAQSAANSLHAASINLQYDPTNGFSSVKEGGTLGSQFIDAYTSKFADQQSEIRSQLTSPAQQRLFDMHAGIAASQFKQALLEHQATQTDAFNKTTDNATVSNALRSMATRPTDELNFQTQMLAINATLDAAGKRQGLSDAVVQQLKSTNFDAAYGTRILSIANGIPGVVQANPYLAESMFKQVQDQLGPQAQVTLAHTVQEAIRPVQQRDLALKIVNGVMPTSPDVLWHVAGGGDAMLGVVKNLETGSGPGTNAVSSKGAEGPMQVMKATQADPGFGVRPAQVGADGKPLPGELERVGRDYLGAMTARYDNPALVLAAYNAGPGTVDDWIAGTNNTGRNPNHVTLGDPRTGQVSASDWAAKIPFDETKKYVANGMTQLAAAHVEATAPDAARANPAQFAGTTGADGALPPVAQQVQPQPVTAVDLKTRLPGMMAAARDSWLQMYPNDLVGADGAATRVANYGQLAVAQQQAAQEAARETLLRGVMGAAPDGSQRAPSMDALLADPQVKAAWNSATPDVQLAIQDRMKAGGDPPRSAATQALVYQYMGQYANDRQGFANTDLTPLISKLPYADFDKLAGLQVAARNKADLDADKQASLTHALTLARDYAMKPAGIVVPNDKTSPDSAIAKNYNAYTGALAQGLDDFYAQNKRRPNDQEIVALAKGLTTSVQAPGRWWGTNATPAYQITPENVGATKVTVPADFRTGISNAIKAKTGKDATEQQVQTAYLTHLNPTLAH